MAKNGTNAMPCVPHRSSSVISGRCLQPVAVLHADHRRDRPCLGQLLRADPGYAQMADQPGGTQRSEGGEMFSDRRAFGAARDAQVDHVEVISAELAQILLNLPAQLARLGPVPLTRRVAARPDLVVITRSSG